MEKKHYVDFQALKDRVSILDVLGRYNVRLKAAGKSQFRGACPLPSHSSKESRESFFANPQKGVWCCHSDSCKKASGREGGSVIDLVAAMEALTAQEAARRLEEWFPQGSAVKAPPESPTNQSGDPALDATKQNKPLGFRLKDVSPEHPMIQAKGISVETARDWGVGHFPGKGSMKNRIVFPLHEGGDLVGYIGRTVLPVTHENPKWLVAKGLVKSFLFGLERCDPGKSLVIVEGCWPVLKFHQQRIQTAALLGSEMTDAQEARLEPFKTIWVMMDGDAKGRAATDKIAARLKALGHNALKASLKD